MQWLQGPNQSNVDNVNNVKRKASRHFRNKNREYLKTKSNELKTNVRTRISENCIRASVTLKNIVKDKKGDLVADPHSTFARWRNYFSHLLTVRGVNNVQETETHTAELLVPEPSAFKVEMAIEKLKRHKSPRIDQILAELTKAASRTIHSESHKLIISI
jgi:hypothetical protein